jgi:proteasome assembly chaperone (PAC2) family protein
MENLVVYETPELRQPVLVAGFGGWADAAEVSTGVVSYLVQRLKAKKFAEILQEGFYVTSSLRPMVTIEGGLIAALKFPTNEFLYWKNDSPGHDLVFFLGVEPHMKWDEYVAAILQIAEQLGVRRIYTIGGVYEPVAHTWDPVVSALISDSSLEAELANYGIELPEYYGPTSIHIALLAACKEKGIESISLWGQSPHYVRVRNSKVCYGVLTKLTQMLHINISLEDIKSSAARLEAQIDKAVDRDPRLRAYVEKLEEGPSVIPKAYRQPTIGADSIIHEIEEFLKKNYREDNLSE